MASTYAVERYSNDIFKIKKTVLKCFSIYRRLLSYDLSYGLLLVLRSRYPWSLTSSNHKGVRRKSPRKRRGPCAPNPSYPMGLHATIPSVSRGPTLAVILLFRLHDRAWILIKDAKHFSTGKLLPFAALTERKSPFVSCPPCYLKEKVGSSHKHQPGGFPKRPGLPTKQSYYVYLTEKQTG